MNRLLIYCLALSLVYILSSCDKKIRVSDKPNIIVIFTDDQGYADLGVQNVNNDVITPNIDKLAETGIRFTSGYVTAPQCSPSRAGIITGRYQQKFGFDDNDKGPLPVEEVTIADRIRKLGYTTGMVGKWHMDPNHTSHNWLEKHYPETLKDKSHPIPKELRAPHTPAENGFDYFFWGTMHSYSANYDLDGDTYRRAKHISDKRFRVEVQTEAAVQFIENNQFDPFFLYVSYFAPHVPLEATNDYLKKFESIESERRKHGLAMISAIDDGVGKIVSLLEQLQLDNNTMIFFISDNGAPLKLSMPDTPITGIAGPEWDGSLNDPWVGEKGMLTEGGIRVPFILNWKDSLPKGKVIDFPVSTLDVAATSLSVANTGQQEYELDGINIIPFIKQSISPDRSLKWRFWNQAAIRKNNWKYLFLSDGHEFLFDLENENHERNNLINQYPEKANELKLELNEWSQSLKSKGLVKGPLNGQEKSWYKYHLKL